MSEEVRDYCELAIQYAKDCVADKKRARTGKMLQLAAVRLAIPTGSERVLRKRQKCRAR